MASSPPEDVRKMGFLKKLKTMKSKMFVLREAPGSHDARLEYYDSDKKFKKGIPKRSISLRKCFSINKKSDARNRFIIQLYTKDDCFSIVCENENEQEEWLQTMLELRSGKEGDETPPFFEHIWPVTVRSRGLSSTGAVSPGAYRLCLTNTELKLVKVNQDEVIDFQLASIRRCGHTECFFLIEIGRSAKTGEGELWMQVEDSTIALSMHEVIRSAMKSSKSEQEPPPTVHGVRNRSSSSVDPHHRPRHNKKPTRQPSLPSSAGSGYDASTLPFTRSKQTPSLVISDGQRSPIARRHSHSPGKGSVLSAAPGNVLSLAHSPSGSGIHPFSFLAEDDPRTRTDSMESHGSRGTASSLSAEELDAVHSDHQPSSGGGSTRSVTPDGPIEEERDPYMIMNAGASTPKWARDITSPSLDSSTQSYLPMTPGVTPSTTPGSSHGSGNSTPQSYSKQSADGGASYMGMSPGLPPTPPGSAYMNMSQTSGSASSTTSSTHEMEENGYLDMKPCSQSLPKTDTLAVDGGYLEMLPGAGNNSPQPSNASSSSSSSLRPEKVCSYLRNDSSLDSPRRAYSVGSKPTAMLSKPQNNSFTDNIATLEKVQSKSCSAPHLLDKEKHHHPPVLPGNEELFMEMDFKDHKPEDDEFRERTCSSGSRDFRPRTSSGGSRDLRPRTSSFGTGERMRAGSFGSRDAIKKGLQGHRPRTATICQDFLRERTNSFGPSDNMRPRSSSYGNARLKEVRKLGRDWSNSNEALRRGSGRTPSQDSLKRSQRLIGNDMKKLTPSAKQKSQEYMDMSRGSTDSVNKQQDYVEMKNPTPSPSPSASRLVSFNAHREKLAPSDDYSFIQPGVGVSSSPVTPPEKPGSDYCLMEASGEDYMMMTIEKSQGGATKSSSTSSSQLPSSHHHGGTSQQSKLSSSTLASASKEKNVAQGSPKGGPRSTKDKGAPPARSAGKATSTIDKPWTSPPTMQNVPEESSSGDYVEIGFGAKGGSESTSGKTSPKPTASAASKPRQVPSTKVKPPPVSVQVPALSTSPQAQTEQKQAKPADNSYVVYSPADFADSAPSPSSAVGQLEKVRSPLSREDDCESPNKIKKSSLSPFPELGKVSRTTASKLDSYADMDFSQKPLSVDVSEPPKSKSPSPTPLKHSSTSGSSGLRRQASPGGATGLHKQTSPGSSTRSSKHGSTGGASGLSKQLSPGGATVASKHHCSESTTGTGINKQHSPRVSGRQRASAMSGGVGTGTDRQGAGGLNNLSPRAGASAEHSPGATAGVLQHSPGGVTSSKNSTARIAVPVPSPSARPSGTEKSKHVAQSSTVAPVSVAAVDEGDYMEISPPVESNPTPQRKTTPPVPKLPAGKQTAPPVTKSEKDPKERRSSTGSYGPNKQPPGKPSSSSSNTLNIWPQTKMPSRGSTGSLATLNEHQNLSKMTSRGSAGSLTGMDSPGSQQGATANPQLTQQLNYATLELLPGSQAPPSSAPAINNPSAVVNNNQVAEPALQYAQIDFTKSGENPNAKNSTSNSKEKENRLSFS